MVSGLNTTVPRMEIEEQFKRFMEDMVLQEGYEPENAIWEVIVESDFMKGIDMKKKIKLLKGKLEKIQWQNNKG